MTGGRPRPETVARWRRTLAEHRQRDGRCPVCGTEKRCWPWADAFGELVAHDLLRLGPPLTPLVDDRSQKATGERKEEDHGTGGMEEADAL
ncbi:hypothetical protein QTQ03_20480 [Micromonospora sp. WMMA1363]|uniref:hypothetical protein n=1 Tax=Micromonospora sp. WMMA1363 TaxID=3053985 RepID=UPI00259CE096|nr:hypothetical protein [Micromonospora sp. WMMA1363]MDM4718443.1 hypothetical protein [Micromonospora sp. WMMA1363]MDM4721856.1 hypothetical protein [Micromonospora sp. WMMA1363]